jgi:LPS-assembly protein
VVNAERIAGDSYVSIAAGPFKGCGRPTCEASSRSCSPRSTPASAWRLVLDGPVVELQGEQPLPPDELPDRITQRAFASARWDRRSITGLGQELLLTGYARADVYHANDTALTPVAATAARKA